TRAMGSYLEALGGKIETDTTIHTLDVFPEDQLILFNNTPYQILDMAGDRLSASYTNKLKNYQYGSGVFKVDLALSEEIPWKDELCKEAGTVHVGGTFEEIEPPKRLRQMENTQTTLMCWSPSKACLIIVARLVKSIQAGPTVTFPMDLQRI